MWASTKNETLKEKIYKAVTILAECQKQMGTGYLSAFPSELFDRFETLRAVWAPYYTIHKIMAGLLDLYTFAESGEALRILKWMVDYHYERVINTIQKYTIQRHWNSLNEEVGGMNDLLYRLYAVTGDEKHLRFAHLFDKPCFLGELAMEADDISSYHANTHIPLVIGAQMRYEVTGDPLYRDISTYFVDMINSSHTYATGGTSENEHWTDPKRLASTLTTENQESCTTYNMLKVIRNLFRWTKDTRYADYYERALINGVLPIQRGTEPGVMIYFLPQKPGASKATSSRGWGHKHDSMWCCYGSATESFAKLGDTIYFEEEGKVPGIYVVQYIPSTFNWNTRNVKFEMKVQPVSSSNKRLQVTLALDHGHTQTKMATVNLRIPAWTDTRLATAKLNHYNFKVPAPGTFLSITRKWKPRDEIKLELPISLRLEAISDDRPEYASLQAILYGPYLLAGLSKGDKDINAAGNAVITDWITPVPEEYNSSLISLSQSGGNSQLFFAASPESVKLQNSPNPGTTEAADSTLRVILKDSSENHKTPWEAIGKSIMLEPFGNPDMLVAHQGPNKPLGLVPSSSSDDSSVFKLVPGLDGASETFSFQSMNRKDCYIQSGPENNVILGCRGGDSGDFSRAVSFKMDKGLSEYHPISFIAKGGTRSFLLVPLLSLKDEHYTLYFNI
ncbi:OLC1v1005763C2 [Oldenlandia corymbosa var. corymbosa]|nr:OLC1v1005763C2 [Oldenlandia corymbosa var. corymbosa]